MLKKESNGEITYNPIGYYPDIMNLLMARLNFTINSTVPQKRSNWKYLVSQINKRHYDIGYTFFIFNPHRNKVADFSFGISPSIMSLFYVKGSTLSSMDVFLKPFRSLRSFLPAQNLVKVPLQL